MNGITVEKTNVIGVEKVDCLPAHLRGTISRGGKWQWMRDLILGEMQDEAFQHNQSIRKITFPNPKEMRRAQTSVANCSFSENGVGNKQQLPSKRYTLRTRSEVDNNTGYGILYIILTHSALGI